MRWHFKIYGLWICKLQFLALCLQTFCHVNNRWLLKYKGSFMIGRLLGYLRKWNHVQHFWAEIESWFSFVRRFCNGRQFHFLDSTRNFIFNWNLSASARFFLCYHVVLCFYDCWYLTFFYKQVCRNAPQIRDTNHLFLDLPALRNKLEEYINNMSVAGSWSQNAIQATHAWLKEGLKVRCITRDLKWGVPVPLERFKEKVT